MNLKPLEKHNLFPAPHSLRKLIGPSFIILALGLGSGEVILWPHLAANYGLGIIWGALLGLTFQFFINMEIERYALVHGESIFVGFARKFRYLSFWFLISTFIPWMWPGIIASSAKFLGTLIGINDSHYLAIALLILIGVILSLGPILYKTVESLQKSIIILGVPSIFLLSILLAKPESWIKLAQGSVGIGEGYLFLPEGIALASFLGALAYAGAGGNLNLAQSYYVKEKGYGMAIHAGRITSLLTGKSEHVSLTGKKFEPNAENLSYFRTWWRNINIEHFLVFWLTGSITILLFALLSYLTVFGQPGNEVGVNFVINEARIIGEKIFPIAGTFFLLIVTITLFGTQLGVFDATSRILSENIILSSFGKLDEHSLRPLYYIVLWLQISAGVVILLLGFREPLQLIIIAAVLNAVAMFVHTGLTLWLNSTLLDKEVRPSVYRKIAMLLALFFYGGFSLFTVYNILLK